MNPGSTGTVACRGKSGWTPTGSNPSLPRSDRRIGRRWSWWASRANPSWFWSRLSPRGPQPTGARWLSTSGLQNIGLTTWKTTRSSCRISCYCEAMRGPILPPKPSSIWKVEGGTNQTEPLQSRPEPLDRFPFPHSGRAAAARQSDQSLAGKLFYGMLG